jgi:hypothetical protein
VVVIVVSRILNSKKDEWKLLWGEQKNRVYRKDSKGLRAPKRLIISCRYLSIIKNLIYAVRVYLDLGELGFYHIEPFEIKNI